MTIVGVLRNLDGSEIVHVNVLDISQGGAKLSLLFPAKLGDTFLLSLSSDNGVQRKCSLVWRTGDTLGVRFAVV